LLYCFENFVLDTDCRELIGGPDQARVAMTPQVFDLLEYLIRSRARVVSKDDLIASVWSGRAVSDSALTTRINAARCAIGDTGEEQRLIRTVRRKGVRFVGIVQEKQNSQSAANMNRPEPPVYALALPEKPSIAVLPFANMSDDPAQEYFAEGIAEEIITALSRCNSLFVIARNSSFTYKGKAVDVRQVGRELGVRYVLEGGVRRAGSRLRFTGQLIDATSGVHIWADRFEGARGDIFALQDQFTEGVVAAIEPTLQLAEIERLKLRVATSLDAYDLLLRAQQREYQFTEESLAEALLHIGQALAIDPNYAQAMALAAHCHADRSQFGWTRAPEADAKEGIRLAWNAVELAKDDANVLWMAAHAVFHLQLDPHRARELAYRSLELNPNSAIALAKAGRVETALGNIDKALDLLQRAERLSPRDPRGWYIVATLAFAHYRKRQYEQAVVAATKALNQYPRYTWPFRILVASLVELGRLTEAKKVALELLGIEPELTLTKLRARLRFREEDDFKEYAAALRLAGLPD
jgi:TolB-like protein/tetratricopeptide (TPR) repeat protein